MNSVYVASVALVVSVAQALPVRSATPANILIARGRTEPSVAVDPRLPDHVVVSTNTNYDLSVGGSYPTGSFSSTNAGRSFYSISAPLVAPYTVAADTTVAIDGHGTLFYSYLAETPAYCTTGHSAILLTHSTDGGKSFRSPHIVDVNAADDKPNMAVETVRGRASRLFLSWTRFHPNHSRTDVWFSRSVDGGVTFSRPLQLLSSLGFNVGTVPVFAGHGRVYGFWNALDGGDDTKPGRGRILMSMSRDQGRHFSAARQIVATFTHVPLIASPGALRNLTMPAVTAASDGTLYLSWPQVARRYADGHVDADIELSRSVDDGRTWSRPFRINSSRTLDRFMPVISAVGDGSVVIAFYDRRRGLGQLDVYVARAHFLGRRHVSNNIRMNRDASPISDILYIDPSSTCFIPGRFFGDYLGLAVDRTGHFDLAWADTQLQVQGETDVWFARSLLPTVG